MWGEKHQMSIIKATTQEPQLQILYFMFVNNHICVVSRSNIYVILAIEISQKVIHKFEYT